MSTVPLSSPAADSGTAPAWHRPLVEYLPLVRKTARLAFAGLPPAEREEAVADAVADTAAGFARLAELGRPHFWLIAPLARYAVRRRHAGRRVGSSMNKNDVLGPVRRGAARVESRDACGAGGWKESLPDSRDVDPAEPAAVRVDFDRWLSSLTSRHREVVLAFARGDRPTELAGRLGVGRARVSQLRAELRASRAAFRGEAGGVDGLPAAA